MVVSIVISTVGIKVVEDKLFICILDSTFHVLPRYLYQKYSVDESLLAHIGLQSL